MARCTTRLFDIHGKQVRHLIMSVGVAAVRCEGLVFGVWRSLVARVVRDDEVAGSNPVTPTRSCGLECHLQATTI